MIIIFQRHKAKGLKNSILRLLDRVQHFGQPLHAPGLRAESNLDEITLAKGVRELQQTSMNGNTLESCFRLLTVFFVDKRLDWKS